MCGPPQVHLRVLRDSPAPRRACPALQCGLPAPVPEQLISTALSFLTSGLDPARRNAAQFLAIAVRVRCMLAEFDRQGGLQRLLAVLRANLVLIVGPQAADARMDKQVGALSSCSRGLAGQRTLLPPCSAGCLTAVLLTSDWADHISCRQLLPDWHTQACKIACILCASMCSMSAVQWPLDAGGLPRYSRAAALLLDAPGPAGQCGAASPAIRQPSFKAGASHLQAGLLHAAAVAMTAR